MTRRIRDAESVYKESMKSTLELSQDDNVEAYEAYLNNTESSGVGKDSQSVQFLRNLSRAGSLSGGKEEENTPRTWSSKKNSTEEKGITEFRKLH